jgi:hypothetical protein
MVFNHISMRVQLLQVALLFTAAYGQISSQITNDLSFDGAAAVSLLWGLDSDMTSTYDFYLCAGDETTGSYVWFLFILQRMELTIYSGHSIASYQ